jgi:hypothetical protein
MSLRTLHRRVREVARWRRPRLVANGTRQQVMTPGTNRRRTIFGAVERIWGALKAWLATSPTLTIQGRLRQVHAFFRQRSPTQILATAAPSSSLWMPTVTCRTSRRPLSSFRMSLTSSVWVTTADAHGDQPSVATKSCQEFAN